MAPPAVTATVMRRCAPAAVLLLGCLTPIAVMAPASSAETSSAPASTAQTLTQARTVYGDAVKAVELIGDQSERLTVSAQRATKQAERLRAEVQDQDGGTIKSVVGRFFSSRPSLADRAIESADNADHLARLAATTKDSLDKAILKAERARLAYDEVLADQARRQVGWSAADAAEFARSLGQPAAGYRVTDREQDARNRAALARWERYLDKLIKADVVPPTAERLADPAQLPGDLEPRRSDAGDPIAGVAELEPDDDGSPLVVLPAETVRAVSTAFGRLGLAKVPAAGSPATFACGGLVADAWGATDQLAADSVNQWRTLEEVPAADAQVGDVVVLGDRSDGLEESGIYLGHHQVIVADPLTGTAAVRPVDGKRLYGVKRVGVPAARPYDAPDQGRCGTPEATPAQNGAAGGSAFQLPMAAGTYQISAGFGSSGPMWVSTHSGQDFAAPLGTDVAAVADGVVTLEKSRWAGTLVRIDHGGGVETWYAHLSEIDVVSGQQVTKGQLVGGVGNEGNSNGPHLHVEVRLDGRAVNPAQVLEIPELPRATHPNGNLPDEALCSASPGSTHLLACDAAVSFRMMSAAFAAELGTTLCITDSYRSVAGQSALAPPSSKSASTFGTSTHGSGRAVDLCGGVERFATPEHRWVTTHGAAYGWVSPSWAAAGGTRPEPWHFESP